jgi:hypothetical protein
MRRLLSGVETNKEFCNFFSSQYISKKGISANRSFSSKRAKFISGGGKLELFKLKGNMFFGGEKLFSRHLRDPSPKRLGHTPYSGGTPQRPGKPATALFTNMAWYLI